MPGHGSDVAVGLENPDPPGILTLTNDCVLEERIVINLELILLDPTSAVRVSRHPSSSQRAIR
ncbi:MAG: hypothetical protein ACRDG6_13985 [Candidatus Limnocylindria bacterium]